VANEGDIVNTRRPAEFVTKRKVDGDTVVAQNANTTNVQIPLDQHVYVTYVIHDGEFSKSFQDLINTFIRPASMQIARSVDRILCGQAPQFLDNAVGRLEEMTSSNAKDFLIAADQKLSENKAYMEGRALVLSPASRADLLGTELFVAANQRGDGGLALEQARLGQLYSFMTFMDQNVNFRTRTAAETASGNHNTGAAAGATGNIAMFVTGYISVVGEYIWIESEGQAHEISATTNAGSDTTGITLVNPYVNTVAAGSDILIYKSNDVNGTYAAGYSKSILLDGIASTKLPVVGQILSFGTTNGSDRHTYTIIETTADTATSVYVWLDRPLEAALANNDLAFPGPAGSFNLAFHRDAIAFVSRPLALPASSTGVQAGLAIYNGVGMRLTMQYDSSIQGTRVTHDILCGTEILDTNLGCVLLG
jgi:hypothetical protein